MRLLLPILFLFEAMMGLAQSAPLRPKLVVNPNPSPTRWNQNILFTDFQGRPFANLYEGIEGSAYFLPEFKSGQLETRNGKLFDSLQVSLDLYHHELHVLQNNKEIVVQDGLVHWLSIRDTVDGEIIDHVFQSGFPVVDKNPSSHFYQVLSTGSYSLLLYRKMELEKTTDVMSGISQQRFVPVEQLYVYHANTIQRFERNPGFLEKLFGSQRDLFEEYRQNHKMNLKNRTELVQLFDSMNAKVKKAF